MKDDRLYLHHVVECIDRIQTYVPEDKGVFEASTLIQDAVLRNLQILAESTQRISTAVRDRHPEFDWRGLSGLRNILAHQYLSIDLNIVWNIIHMELAAIRDQARKILLDLGETTSTPGTDGP